MKHILLFKNEEMTSSEALRASLKEHGLLLDHSKKKLNKLLLELAWLGYVNVEKKEASQVVGVKAAFDPFSITISPEKKKAILEVLQFSGTWLFPKEITSKAEELFGLIITKYELVMIYDELLEVKLIQADFKPRQQKLFKAGPPDDREDEPDEECTDSLI